MATRRTSTPAMRRADSKVYKQVEYNTRRRLANRIKSLPLRDLELLETIAKRVKGEA